MSKKPAKATLTTAMIEEQTAAFLKAGGTVEHVVKGKSGQFASPGSKQTNLNGGIAGSGGRRKENQKPQS